MIGWINVQYTDIRVLLSFSYYYDYTVYYILVYIILLCCPFTCFAHHICIL